MSRPVSGRWAAIELRHLMTLEAVAREGSFRRAAQRLGYVQSTVSQQIAALETLSGERLIERARGTHAVRVTEAGRVLLAHGNVVVDRMQAAEVELAELRDRDGLAVRVGRVDRAGAALMPGLIACLRGRGRAPTVALEDVESVAALLERIEAHELDAGFCPLPLARGAFETHELYVDRLVAVVAKQSSLASRDGPVSLRELGALRLVGTLAARPWVEARLRADGLDPSFVLRCDDDAVLQAVAAAGVAVAIVPATAAAVYRHDTAVLELRPQIAMPLVGVVHSRRRNGDAALGGFIAAARAACRDLGLVDVSDQTDRAVSLAVAGERA
jgi:molybdate transport repressor ModE-like protein